MRKLILKGTVVILLVMIGLSIYGAFLGSEKASVFFNSWPLGIFWGLLFFLLVASLAAFKSLIRKPALLSIHFGSVLIIVGFIWSSQAGHMIQKRFFGIDKIKKGAMLIYEGMAENRVFLQNDIVEELPFYIKLSDFRIEYYQPGFVNIWSEDSEHRKFPAEVGYEFKLDDTRKLKVLRIFNNFKINLNAEKREAYDSTAPGSNPAVEMEYSDESGANTSFYVFEQFAPVEMKQAPYHISYSRSIREYISDLEVIDADGKQLYKKSIEVNHPMHFGGYHFYQQSYDEENEQYTILQVASDSGSKTIFIGYCLLSLGVIWQCWFKNKIKKIESDQENGN